MGMLGPQETSNRIAIYALPSLVVDIDEQI
jgi:hypothetical protein